MVLMFMYSDRGSFREYRVFMFMYSDGGSFMAYLVFMFMYSDGGSFRGRWTIVAVLELKVGTYLKK